MLKIIFFGTPQEVVPVLESLVKHFTVVAVVTTPDQKAGRRQLLTPPPIKVVAQKYNIPVFQPESFSSTASLSKLPTADLYVVAAYGKLIPNDILQTPHYDAINIHPSLLPMYRGATPIQTALLNGDRTTGITIIKMDNQMDHGPILHQLSYKLEETDTFELLMKKMFTQAAMILPHVIEEYTSGRLTPQPQDESKATYTKMITKEDGYIDLSKIKTLNAVEIENWKLNIARTIRAYYPWPSVWTKISMKNHEVRMKFLPNNQLQIEGKKPMSIQDFINGYPEMKEKIEKLYK